MSKKNKKIQAIDLLVSLFDCNLEDMDYLMYLINKAQNGHEGDILSSIMFGLSLDCASYNLRNIVDEIFGELGTIILEKIISKKMREGGRCEITLDGSKVKAKTCNFDMSIIKSEHITMI